MAVQPAPVVSLLKERLAADMKRYDVNGDGTVSEVEALTRLGWKWNQYNKPIDEDLDTVAARRSAAVLKEVDKGGDGKLSFDIGFLVSTVDPLPVVPQQLARLVE